MAMQLYGKSWGELQAILKLTPEKLDEARETAERLHLIVGPEGIAQSVAYKTNMREIGLVAESLSIQLGNELMPAVVSVGSALGGAGTNGASLFGKALKEVVRDIQEATVYWASFADKTLAFFANAFNGKGMFSEEGLDDYAAHAKNIDAGAMGQMAEIAKGYDQKPKSSAPSDGDRIAVPISGDAAKAANEYAKQIKSAHDAYLSYEKAFAEQKAAIIKNAAALEGEINKIAYDMGLVDLKTYLDKKHLLNESALQAEIDAKKTEQKNAQDAEKRANAAYKKDPTGDTAKNANEAAAKSTAARTAVLDAENKLALARKTNAEESRTQTEAQVTEYKQLGIQIMELAGQYENAAKARRDLMLADPKFKALPQNIQDEKKALAAADVNKGAAQDKANSQNLGFDIRGIKNSTPSIFGNTDGAAALKLEYDKEMALIKSQILLKEQLNEKETSDYQQMLEKKQVLTERYAAQQNKLSMDSYKEMGGIVSGQLGQIAGMMNKSNQDQFIAWKALASAQAAISTALAVAGILGSESLKGAGVAIPLAFMAGAIGAAEIGIIAGTQYSGAREAGGPVTGGETYLVGEKGPELFTPGATGAITPNHALGGGQVAITNNYDFRNADPATEQRMRAYVDQSNEKVKADIMNGMNRGGKWALASGRIH
jgi:hypothetical protein